MQLPKMFEQTHAEMAARNLRVLEVPILLSNAYYFRHPDDIAAILSKDDVLFAKSARVAQSKEWLGSGIFSQLDADAHASARALLNPAFRQDYLRQLDGMMVAAAQQLADLLLAAAEAAAAEAAAPPGGGGSGGLSGGGALDMQRLFRLLTLDTIVPTSLNTSFEAMRLWEQRQHAQAGGGSGSSSSSGSSQGGAAQVDVEQLLWDLEAAFMLQSLQLPVPRSWLPGWRKYIHAARLLDECIYSVLEQVRAQQQQQQQQHQPPGKSAGSTGSTSSSSSVSDSASRRTLASFLLAAQRERGADAVSDEAIASEIKTILFGGTDTSSFTLAMLAHHLAQQPAAAQRAAAEVQQLLRGSGRRDVSQLAADDVGRLPFVTACINETMRVAPAGPVVTRTALQDTELGGYHLRKGQSVAANLYAMHRHPDIWPQPDAWLPERWLPDEAAAAGLTMRTIAPRSQAFIPFSIGPRSCIGRSYAMLQMVLAAAVLLGRGVRFELAPGKPAPSLAKGMTMHSESGVWLVPRIAAAEV